MKAIVEGHTYQATNFEFPEKSGQVIQFIHKEPDGDGGFVLLCDGTTNEELIAILIDRIVFQNSKFPSKYNSHAIGHLDLALTALVDRTADRKKRNVEGKPLN
jgi:hypothetical protein